jgi:hypothetical protein
MKRNLAVSLELTAMASSSRTDKPQSRQLSLPGSESFASPADQAQRFLVDSLGEGKFTRSGAKNLWEVRQGVIPPEELRR